MKIPALILFSLMGFNSCTNTPPVSPEPPLWRHVTELPEPAPPRGTIAYPDEKTITLTLPNGHCFRVESASAAQAAISFPNGQIFGAETANGGFQAPYVNADESLVASIVLPSTQSGDLHIFTATQNGQYEEINNVNQKIDELLVNAKAPFGAGALRIMDLNGRILTLASVDYGEHRGEADLFKIQVSNIGTFSLTK